MNSLLISLAERFRAYAFANDLSILLELLNPVKSDVILDVGAGSGWIAEKVAKMSDDVYALEPDVSKVNYCKAHHMEVKIFSAKANSIPFPNNYFDKLYVASAFHHFSDQGDTLEEFRRVLKKQGQLVIQDFDPGTSGRFLCNFETKILRKDVRFLKPIEFEELARNHEFAKLSERNSTRSYLMLFENEKKGESASGWLDPSSLMEEKASRRG